MARDERRPVYMHYVRQGDELAFRITNVDEHELRSILVALWLILDGPSRKDVIHELARYHEAPDARPPQVSQAIADAYRAAR